MHLVATQLFHNTRARILFAFFLFIYLSFSICSSMHVLAPFCVVSVVYMYVEKCLYVYVCVC